MARALFILLVLIQTTVLHPATAREPVERTLSVGDLTRSYLEFAPPGLNPGAPMVVLLHGGGGSMRKLFGDRRPTRRWLDLAREHGFLLLAPNGVNRRNGDPAGDRQAWNDLCEDGPPDAATIDDVAFIAALVATAAQAHGSDRTRVYVTGASNGGMMTYRLLVERPALFAAGVAFIANLPESDVPEPDWPTPILIVNGTKDPLMPYDGGQIGRNRGLVRSTDATVAYWRRVNNAFASPDGPTTLPDRVPDDGCRLIETRYPAGPEGAEVLLIRMEGGGHGIPSPTPPRYGPLARRILGPSCQEMDGVDRAWTFMRRHRR